MAQPKFVALLLTVALLSGCSFLPATTPDTPKDIFQTFDRKGLIDLDEFPLSPKQTQCAGSDCMETYTNGQLTVSVLDDARTAQLVFGRTENNTNVSSLYVHYQLENFVISYLAGPPEDEERFYDVVTAMEP